MRRRTARGFHAVDTWVFDLDNTLYPHHVNLWQQVDERIRDYIAAFLKIPPAEAFRVQKEYYKRYGTSRLRARSSNIAARAGSRACALRKRA